MISISFFSIPDSLSEKLQLQQRENIIIKKIGGLKNIFIENRFLENIDLNFFNDSKKLK